MKKLLAISAAMRSSRPVFIVGEARSGTSILYRTLQKHSSFRPIQVSLVETEIFSHLRRTFMFGRTRPDSLKRFMMNDEEAYREFLRSIRPIRILSASAVGVNFICRDRYDWLWYANLNHLLLRSYFFYATRARGCRRLVEKTPTNTPNIERLWRTFPSAQFLYVHRHPVDVFSSYRRRAKADPTARWAAQITPAVFRQRYQASVERVRNWQRDHRNLLLVKYEGFTRDPAGEFNRVCGFLDEPLEPEAVQEPNPDLNRWRGDPHLWGEIVAVTKDWRDYMTSAEANEVQTGLSHEMTWLGHEPYELGATSST